MHGNGATVKNNLHVGSSFRVPFERQGEVTMPDQS